MRIRRSITLLTTCIASMLSGCAAFDQSPRIAIVRGNGKSEVPVTVLAKDPELSDLHHLAGLVVVFQENQSIKNL